jgi:hypothetical protein
LDMPSDSRKELLTPNWNLEGGQGETEKPKSL